MSYAERNSSTKKLTGRWVCDATYAHPDGSTTRWHKAFPSKGEADGAEAYYRATGTIPKQHQSAPTNTYGHIAEEFKTRHTEWLRAHDGRTNAMRLQMSITHLGALDIKAVRGRELLKYRDTLVARLGVAGKPPGNRTINKYLDAVSKVLRFALSLDEIPGLPQMPRMSDEGEVRDAVPWLTEDRVCALLQSKGWDTEAFLVRVLAATGLRAGELHGLQSTQIETPDQIENTGIMLHPEQTKTNAARWVPIAPAAAMKLRALIASGSMPNAARLRHKFKEAVIALGENPKLTIHCLRHATITRLEQLDGVKEIDVCKITGHRHPAVPKVHLRYYHPDKAHLFNVAEKVQSRLGETPQLGDVVAFRKPDKSGCLEATPGIEPGYTVLQTGK